jgi:hypothetical protein
VAELSGTPEASSAPIDGERLGARRRIFVILTLLGCTGAAALGLSSCHPPVSASLETDLPASSGSLNLTHASALGPTTSELGALALIHDGSQIPGTGEKLTIRMQVSRAGCSRLVARVGGTCNGRPGVAIRPQTNLKIQAATGTFTIGVWPIHPQRVEVAQAGELAHRGAPVAWVMAENATKTIIEFECTEATSLTITLSPRQGSGLCRPQGVSYRLDLVNDGAFAPALSLTQVQSFEAGFRSERARIDAKGGTLTVGDDGEALPRATVHAVELRSSPGKTIRAETAAPAEDRWAESWLRTARADHVLVDGEEKVQSRLARSTRVPEWIALLVGMFLDAVISLIVIRRY